MFCSFCSKPVFKVYIEREHINQYSITSSPLVRVAVIRSLCEEGQVVRQSVPWEGTPSSFSHLHPLSEI